MKSTLLILLLVSVVLIFAEEPEIEPNYFDADPQQCSACMLASQKAFQTLGCKASPAQIDAYCGSMANQCQGTIDAMCARTCSKIGPCSRKHCCSGGFCNCGSGHTGETTKAAAAIAAVNTAGGQQSSTASSSGSGSSSGDWSVGDASIGGAFGASAGAGNSGGSGGSGGGSGGSGGGFSGGASNGGWSERK